MKNASRPIFTGIEENAVAEFLAAGTSEAYAAGDLICSRGEHEPAMYFLESGAVQIIVQTAHGPVLADRLEQGEVFGELSMIDGLPRSADVVAETDVVVHRFDRDRILELRKRNDPSTYRVLFNVALVVTARLRMLNDLLFGPVALRKGEARSDERTRSFWKNVAGLVKRG